MKLTRSQLRKLIKEMAWDPSASETPHPHFKHDTPEYYQKFLQSTSSKDKAEKRALGLLSKSEAEAEKKIIADYQETYKAEINKFYKELRKPLDTAQITCLHAPSYFGSVTNKQYDVSIKPWIQKFGSSGKNQISTIMVPFGISKMYQALILRNISSNPNVSSILMDGYSFILGGFPVMMSYDDMMTQTLSNLHPDLVKFQASSGTSKSSGKTPDIISYQKFLTQTHASDETVLDNWFVKGVHYTVGSSQMMPSMEKESLEALPKIAEECKALNLPLYVTEKGNLSKGTYKYN
jgi:hypothetical protein